MTATLHIVTAGCPAPHLLCPCAECRDFARHVIRLRAYATPHRYNPACRCDSCVGADQPVDFEARREQARLNERLEQVGQPWHPRKPRQLRNAA